MSGNQNGVHGNMRLLSQYSEVMGAGAKPRARRIALSVLGRIGGVVGLLPLLRRRPRVHILLYHHVFDDEICGFRRQIEGLVAEGHTFISYDEAVRRMRTGDIDRPYMAVSFDDGLVSCLTAGRILREYGVSGCFFLSTGWIADRRKSARGVYTKTGPAGVFEYMSWSDVRDLVDMGHVVGCHTHSHPNLGELSEEEVASDVAANIALLEDHGHSPRHFAWPFGGFADFSIEARSAVLRLGFDSYASGVRGAHVGGAGEGSFCIRRESVFGGWPRGIFSLAVAASSATARPTNYSWGPID